MWNQTATFLRLPRLFNCTDLGSHPAILNRVFNYQKCVSTCWTFGQRSIHSLSPWLRTPELTLTRGWKYLPWIHEFCEFPAAPECLEVHAVDFSEVIVSSSELTQSPWGNILQEKGAHEPFGSNLNTVSPFDRDNGFGWWRSYLWNEVTPWW